MKHMIIVLSLFFHNPINNLYNEEDEEKTQSTTYIQYLQFVVSGERQVAEGFLEQHLDLLPYPFRTMFKCDTADGNFWERCRNFPKLIGAHKLMRYYKIFMSFFLVIIAKGNISGKIQ
jgi:hypothetical protein